MEKDLSISIFFLSYCVGYLAAKDTTDTANSKDTDVFMWYLRCASIEAPSFPFTSRWSLHA